MLDGDEWQYPHRDDEGPEAKLHRLELELERALHREIVRLHASLPAHSSEISLFSFAECREWGLRKNARRSKEDGA
jgi:hypothetical protein